MGKQTMMKDAAMIAKLYEVLDVEDYFQRFDAFEDLLRQWNFKV